MGSRAATLANGLGLLPWSLLAGGVLTGKYAREQPPEEGTRLAGSLVAAWYDERPAEQRTWNVLEALRGVANDTGSSLGQVALAWLAARPGVSSVILGARTSEQLRDNLAAADLKLDPAAIERLDAASSMDVDYPYNTRDQQIRSRNVDGSFAMS